MAAAAGPLPVLHLARRFFGSLRPGPPDRADESWAVGHLSPGELEVWRRMSNPDRRHAVAVARDVVAELARPGDQPVAREVVAAALLHDSGKVVSGLRTPARVVATVLWAVADDDLVDRWLALGDDRSEAGAVGPSPEIRYRLAAYRRHPELGSELLEAAGSDPLTVAWAGQHHQPESAWSVPVEIGRVLRSCDDD